jgi:hypothetical protein
MVVVVLVVVVLRVCCGIGLFRFLVDRVVGRIRRWWVKRAAAGKKANEQEERDERGDRDGAVVGCV